MRGQGRDSEQIPIVYLIGRLWIPLSIFLFFLVSIFSKEEILDRFLGNASVVVHKVVLYGTQIGLWMSTAFLVQRLVTIFIWDGLISGISGRPVPRLPKDVTALVIFGISLIGVLATVFDQSVTGIWATSGVLSIVIGVALRNVILDVFIGLSMHIEQPFRIGDWVMVHQNRRETHIVGQVIEINWRTTRLKTTQKNMVVVPNSKMGEAILTNYMQPKPHFRIDLSFMLDYSVSPDRAIRVLTSGVKALADNYRILSNPSPEVRFEEACASGQKYEVRFFILPVNISPKESKHIVNKSIIEHLSKAGLTPSMDKEMVFMEHGHKFPHMVSAKDENFDQVICGSELFGILEEADQRELVSSLRRKDLKGGEVLYRQGNLGDSIYFLAEGLLCSSIDNPDSDNMEKVERFTSGVHFGCEAILKKSNRMSTVVALTDSVVFSLDPQTVSQVASRNGEFLALLNEKMFLGQQRIINTKWRMQKKDPKSKPVRSKKGVGKTLQTFFSDLFPSPNPSGNKSK